MHPHTRAMIAASAHAFIIGRKVAGLYDHAAGRHLRVAAEARGEHLQGLDGDRAARFGGTLPELYDVVDKNHVSLEITGTDARGYDRASGGHYEVKVTDRQVQLFDHSENAWFTFDVQTVEDAPAP